MNKQIIHLINNASHAYENGSLEHARHLALQALALLAPEYQNGSITQMQPVNVI